jgi:hypothetical protein
MWPGFNIIKPVVSTLIGVAMILMGTVWILQGFSLVDSWGQLPIDDLRDDLDAVRHR